MTVPARTLWSKQAPTTPGWYWVLLQTEFAALLGEDGLWCPGERDTEELIKDGARFGPRVPSAEALEMAENALRDAAFQGLTMDNLLIPSEPLRLALIRCIEALAALRGEA